MNLKKDWKYILLALLGGIAIFFFSKKYIEENQNKIEADTAAVEASFDVNVYKAYLIDSLKNVLKPGKIIEYKTKYAAVNVDSIYAEAKRFWQLKFEEEKISLDTNQFVYTSVIDTTVRIIDSLNNVTDLSVLSVFASPMPLHPSSVHSVGISQIFRKSEPIFDLNNLPFGISVQFGLGYGMINKVFDTYVGVGIHYKIKF